MAINARYHASMFRSSVVAAVIAACGGGSGGGERGPVYTPGAAYGLHGIAPDCIVTKTPSEVVKVKHTCSGAVGLVNVSLGEADHLRSLDVKLGSRTLIQAKAHLVPALTPVLGKAHVDTFIAKLTTMRLGDTARLLLGDATVDVVAGGRWAMTPEYAVAIVW
jgi:hypothetical protein